METAIKILFATDFSPGSNAALSNLRQLKKLADLDVSFIHVLPSFWKDWFSSGLHQKEAMQRLQSWQQELGEEVDESKLTMKVGNPANYILAEAKNKHVNLIMLGARNIVQKGRYKSGGTVESVVRNATQSVLLSKSDRFNKIICGIDTSPASGKALQWAIQIAKKFQSELSIVYIIPRVSAQALAMTEDELMKAEAKQKQAVHENVDKFLQGFDLTDVNYKVLIQWGRPSHVILDMAEDLHYDLIVVGAKGHSMLEHVLMGSTSEKILRFAPCSLFVVR